METLFDIGIASGTFVATIGFLEMGLWPAAVLTMVIYTMYARRSGKNKD